MNLKKLKQACMIGLTAIMISSLAAPVRTDAAAWKKNNVGWWWQEDNGSYPAGTWKTINGKKYCFDQRGYMKSGWHWDGSSWYYLGGVNDGAMKTGWQKVNGKWYFMNSDGKMATGWKTINSKKYFLENSGAMHSGWLWDGSNWYYLGGVNDGAMKTGWQKVNGKWYYMYDNGKMAANTWIGQWYVDGSGAWIKTKEPAKWIKSGNRWWYRHEDGGYTINGFETIGGKKYYFDAAGWMVTGWQKVNNSQWYYFDGSGAMVTNQWIGDYYVGSSGAMAVNTWIGNYYVGSDGAWIPGYTQTKPEQTTVKVRSISLNRTSALLTQEGQTVQLSATVSPSNAANRKLQWNSLDKNVATVDNNGLVTAVGNGNCTIVAESTDGSKKSSTCEVTVNIPAVPSKDEIKVQGVTFDLSDFPESLQVGDDSGFLSINPEGTINPADITYKIADGNAQLLCDYNTPNLLMGDTEQYVHDYYVSDWKNMMAYVSTSYEPDMYLQYRVEIYGQLKTGSFPVSVYYKNDLLRTCMVTITCADATAVNCRKWMDDLEEKAWTDNMTAEEKLTAIKDYIYDNYSYTTDGYMCNQGAMALLYAARDLGLNARYRFVGPNYDYSKGYGDVYYHLGSAACGGHVCTIITINGQDKFYETQGHPG